MPALNIRLIFILIICVIPAYPSRSEPLPLYLDKINACDDIKKAYYFLKNPEINCRPPSNHIEQIINSSDFPGEMDICFLDRPPIPSLAKHICLTSSYHDSRELLCFRPVPAEIITDYQQNFVDKYSAIASLYITEAKSCPFYNIDASRTIRTLFPGLLMTVAEHGFGFNVQFGESNMPANMVRHGFARTSPYMSIFGIHAIEYVAYTDGMKRPKKTSARRGNWDLDVDTYSQTHGQNRIIDLFNYLGTDAFAGFSIGIRRSPLSPPLLKEASLTVRLSNLASTSLKHFGFYEISEEYFAQNFGTTPNAVIREALRNTPYGQPDILNFDTLRARVLAKNNDLPCVRNNNGIIAAYLLTTDGDPGVRVDFGDIVLGFLGLGDCAGPHWPKKYIDGVLEGVKSNILDELGDM